MRRGAGVEAGLLGPPAIQRCDHSLQRDDTIAALDQIGDRFPVEPIVGPQTDPLPSAVRRLEELPPQQQAFDLLRIQAKRNRRTSFDLFEGNEYLLPGFEVGVSPRWRLARFRVGEAERP